MASNFDLFHPEVLTNGKVAGDKAPPKKLTRVDEHATGWWKSWGKCAAGIVGGAGSVGLGGFLGGAAVGTVTLPVVGTVSAAVVGGVGGAIFGGLAGAASAC